MYLKPQSKCHENHTVEARVKRGVAWLDRSDIAKQWRFKVKPESFKFANPDHGPIGQLFGSYQNGLNKLHVMYGEGLGFRSEYNLMDDPKLLKQEWLKALRTDPKWNKIGDSYTRNIKGVRFSIYHYATNPYSGVAKKFRVIMRDGDKTVEFPALYSSLDSAKRSILKFTTVK